MTREPCQTKKSGFSLRVLYCDIGGVLIENPYIFTAKELRKHYGVDEHQCYTELVRLSGPFDRNQISIEEFCGQLSIAFRMRISHTIFKRVLLNTSLRRIPIVWNSLRGLKNSSVFRVVALSNMSEPVWNSLQRKYHIRALFDDVILSFEYETTKPDPGFFRLALGREHVEPSESILLDDSLENVRIARSLGFAAHRATSPAETASFLRSIERDAYHHPNKNPEGYRWSAEADS